ncbi:MAG: dihydropteroate synthase DHPS [Betaproteobacteria bacterium RIFCSPLOWO2_12_FULL_65_14]|nr:MAG: dihydropteroate synthase DHPS [Betaproteobacteria bacterium RIFCSPLOWO2_12_FULL_65_14]
MIEVIGDRINPGFKATRALVEASDLAGLQALAVKQVEAGAVALDFTLGARGKSDPAFLVEAIRAVQDAVEVPLCFDYPDLAVQRVCLEAYDPRRTPIINSLAETRWEMTGLLKIRPCRVMLMASERLEGGAGKPNKTAAEIASTGKRCALRLMREHGLAPQDILVDVSVSALIADTVGLNRAALEAIGLLGADPELEGIHISGGLTNIGQQLPPKAADGSDLKRQLERAFVTVAVPLGFDTVLGTPWHSFEPLPEDNPVLMQFRHILTLNGTDVMRAMRKLYRPG